MIKVSSFTIGGVKTAISILYLVKQKNFVQSNMIHCDHRNPLKDRKLDKATSTVLLWRELAVTERQTQGEVETINFCCDDMMLDVENHKLLIALGRLLNAALNNLFLKQRAKVLIAPKVCKSLLVGLVNQI